MNKKTNSELEYVKIGRLHGYRDFLIPMDEPYKILLSENGQGKTTILKMIDAILTGNLEKIKSINFEYFEVKFKNSKKLNIRKDHLEVEWDSPVFRYFSKKVAPNVLKKVVEMASLSDDNKIINKKIFDYLISVNASIPNVAIRDLVEERNLWISTVKENEFFSSIKEHSKYESLYLPTYRRIEDDLSTLGTSKEISLREVIQFGLGDVERKIESMKASTLATSNESMTRINGEILTRLVNGLSVMEDDKEVIRKNSDLIELVLNRVGYTLSEKDKARIINLVQTGSIFSSSGHDSLIYFLSNLYKAFLDQRLNDEALSAFSEICSSYFVNKTMDYDERELIVKILSNETGKEIKFSQLSSGEKQIVSLFSKLYLDTGAECAVLFDEPELSLSVEWQRKIIHDVIASPRCGILIAMTHSPFIFTGLSKYTSDLASYITKVHAE